MTLDITKIASQIGEMADKIKTGNHERHQHLMTALAKLNDRSVDIEKLKRKIAASHTPWVAAGLCESLNARYPVPACPADYTVLATDGSNIDVDRHKAARCYLINIGAVSLRYGENPAASLESVPRLFSEASDLVIKNEQHKRREQQIEGALLDARRSVEECIYLAQMARGVNDGNRILAVMDGSLVMFGLEGFPDFVLSRLLDEGFLKAMNELQEISRRQNLALASYISLPRSAEVVNALRVAICPHEQVDCDRSCQAEEAACDAISGLNDRLLFAELLQPFERSGLFMNPSAILKRYGPHHVYFYYLRLEDEIARIEVPQWVAANQKLLETSQALIVDQCRRGQGYPVALSEAHEQAVVTMADRQGFWSLVDEALEGQRITAYTSLKSRSKRTRWL
ncbi:MAG TPA: DNA double-strand break repair nuclease NurA [Dehalococcoidales bacterium]|nr:DNA double-strand break repair nuclease NurA [Dehalococcoidales bacterium]